jgi:hypothetical protein
MDRKFCFLDMCLTLHSKVIFTCCTTCSETRRRDPINDDHDDDDKYNDIEPTNTPL